MTTREVRTYGNRTVHRTNATATGTWVLTNCGQNLRDSAVPRHWDGPSADSHIAECQTCFAPAQPETFHVGDFVAFTEDYGTSRAGDRATITDVRTPRTHDVDEGGLYGLYGLRLQRSGNSASVFGRRLRLVDRPPAEPVVYQCTESTHPGNDHYHVTNRRGQLRWHATPNLGQATDEYDDVPGTFNRTATTPPPSLTSDTQQEGSSMTTTQTHEVRGNADHTIHRSTSHGDIGDGRRVDTVCGQSVYDYGHPREYRGTADNFTLTECPTCFATQPEPEVKAEPVNIHPLTAEKLREHPTFTLHSVKGRRDGDLLIFGCQRWGTRDILNNGGTVTLLPDGEVTATVPARADGGGSVRVGGRSLPMGDVNAYTTAIYADPTPPDPDAEVKAALADAVNESSILDGVTMLTNLRGKGFDVVKVQS